MKNPLLNAVHTVAGLFAGFFILTLSLSGSLLVFRDTIDALQKPTVGCKTQNKKRISFDSSLALVKRNFPNASITSCNLYGKTAVPVSFFIYDQSYKNGTTALEIFIDPCNATVLASRSGGADDIRHNFMSWLSTFHNSFHAGKTGEWLLGFFAIVFLISVVTGIILYRKNIMAVLLFKRSAWRRNNLHQLIGTWSLLFNLMMAVTGFWMQRYVFKKEFYQSYEWANTIKPSPGLFFNFDSAYTSLKNKYPNFTGYVIYFAQSKNGTTAIYGSNSTNAYIHSKKFADMIALDNTGAVANTRFINEISASDRYDIINSQLHMGKYGGMGIKIIYGVLGLSAALLSITGFLLWLRRRQRAR